MPKHAVDLGARAPKIASYFEAEEILKSPNFELGALDTESGPFRAGSIVELENDIHLFRRRFEAPLFSKAATLKAKEHLAAAIERCYRQMDSRPRNTRYVQADLAVLLRQLLLETAAHVIGLDGLETAERVSLLTAYAIPLAVAVEVRYSLRDHSQVIGEGLVAKDGFSRDFFVPSWDKRKQMVADFRAGVLERTELPIDLITLMVLNRSETWDNDLPLREAILYLVGVTLTTPDAVMHTIAELDTWSTKHRIDRSVLLDDDFLRRASNEALRLHPPFQARRAIRDTVLKTGTRITAGEAIDLDTAVINRDPLVFGADADRFNPYRQVPDGVRPYGIAFGAGRHVCIGRPLAVDVSGNPEAEEEAMGAIVMILKSFFMHGLATDSAPTRGKTIAERYETFPVRFDNI